MKILSEHEQEELASTLVVTKKIHSETSRK